MTAVLLMTARLLRRAWAGLVALLVLVAIFEFTNPLVAESLGGPEGLEPFLRALPPAFRAIAQVAPDNIVRAGLAGYLALGFTHPLYLTLASVALIGFVARALAGEMERGTIQLALARPISRFRVYAARALGMVLVALALAAAGPLGMIAGLGFTELRDVLVYERFLPTAVAGLLLFWAIGGLTLLGAAAADTTGRAIAFATGVLVISYFVDYFAELWSVLEPAAPFSLFAYYDPFLALTRGELPVRNVLTLLLVGLAGTIGGLVVFARRDLPS